VVRFPPPQRWALFSYVSHGAAAVVALTASVVGAAIAIIPSSLSLFYLGIAGGTDQRLLGSFRAGVPRHDDRAQL